MRLATLSSPVAATPLGLGRSGTLAMTAIVALLLALWIPVHLSFPLGRDQAIIARVTQIMLDGGWPYVDAWDHKGPAAYLLYAPALALFGSPETALYRADLLLLAGVFFAYRAIATRLDLPLAGPLALLLLILCVRNGHWSLAQPDTWIGYLALGAAALLLGPRTGLRLVTFFAVGFAIGFAAMVKPIFAGFLVLPATALASLPAGQRPQRAIVVTALGFASASAAVVVPFVANGHGGALWDAYIAFNIGGHLTRTWQDLGELMQRFFGTFLVPRMHIGMTAILVAAALGYRTMLRRHRRAALVLASGWLVALIGVAIQGKAFPYHFMAVHAFTAAFAAAFVVERIDAIASSGRKAVDRHARRKHAATTGLLLGFAFAAMLPHVSRTLDWWAVHVGAMPRAAFEAEICQIDYCVPKLRAMTELIRADTRPEDPIFVWGFDSAIYLLAERPAASRFGFSYPLIGGTAEWRVRARAELMATLWAAPPRVIVVQTNDYIRLMLSRPSSAHLADFPAFAAFIDTRYVLAHDLGDFQVYRRRD